MGPQFLRNKQNEIILSAPPPINDYLESIP